MSKYAHVKPTGELLGWYDNSIHSKIPKPNIEVSESQWQTAIDNNHNKVNQDGSTERVDWRTDDEREADEKSARINFLKHRLASSDFRVLPDYQERSGKTDAEIEVYRAERKQWYDELVALEG